MKITGTFIDEITYDIPSSNWSRSQWKKEFEYMESIGLDTVIFIRGGFENKCIFPSKSLNLPDYPDFVDFVFKETLKRNINVFFGLYISNLDWNNGDWKGEIEKNKEFIKEVYKRYGSYPNFVGWYVPHEQDRDYLNLAKTIGGLTYLCKETDQNKKVLISPFFHTQIITKDGYFSPEQHYKEWDRIFNFCKDIDICAFQDGTSPIELMPDFYNLTKKLCQKYNIEHWVNVETFERDVRCTYYPIKYEELERKLSLHSEYAEKLITFEFSHFMSPQSIYPSAHNLYERYVTEYLNK